MLPILPGMDPARDAKVSHYRAKLLTRAQEHDIAALEIPVKYSGTMRRIHGRAELERHRQSCSRVHLAFALESR